MAEVIGIASGIAGLISLAMEITRLSYGYISDIRSAHSTQKQYLREISALTEVLLRTEEAAGGLENEAVALSRPTSFSKEAIQDCAKELEDLRTELEKPSPSIFWPLKEKTLKKHVKNLHQFRNLFSGFLAAQTVVTVSATHREVLRLGHQQDQKELLDWIGSAKETSNPILTPLPGTGESFLKSRPYQDWVTGSGGPILWCHGSPGSGKTMLACVALQHLVETLDNPCVVILRYFCDFANRKEQSKEAVWTSFLQQAIAQLQLPAIEALTIFRRQSGTTRPTFSKDLAGILDAICSTQPVLLIFDAPDELEHPKDVKAILSPFMQNNCKILVTSRDLPEIRSLLHKAVILELEANKNDLRTYIASQFEEHDLGDLLERYPELETEIIDKSNELFLLLKIIVNNLLELNTVKEMRKALQSHPDHLDQAFESSLERINAQPKSHSSLAHRVIGWIASAERKLSMSELIHGLATEEENDTIDDENLLAPKTILKVCGGLVITSIRDDSVAMVHTTVYTWFRNRENTSSHEDLARSCLRYLTLRPLSTGSTKSVEDMDKRMASLPFLSYASQHWQKHILNNTIESNLTAAIDVLLDDTDYRSAAFQASNYRNSTEDLSIRSASFEEMPIGQSPLHVVAYWNLSSKARALLEKGCDVNCVDSQSWTPLHWACFGRSMRVVSLFIHEGAEIDAKDSVGWTPLFWAALNGDMAVVELLLASNANHIERDIHGWTALRWAVAKQRTDIIRVLLDHHSNYLARYEQAGKRFLKSLSVSKALSLVECDAQGDLLDELQDETVQADREYDRDDLYNILLTKSLDLGRLWRNGHFDPPVGNVWRTMTKAEKFNGMDHYIFKGSCGSNPQKSWLSGLLFAAIRDDKLMAVKLLIELGADVNHRLNTRSPLHTAAYRKNPAFAEILLEHAADIEALDSKGLTALQHAVMNGFEDTTSLLLEKGANVNASCPKMDEERSDVDFDLWNTDKGLASPKTPLMLACGLSTLSEDPFLSARIVKSLLSRGSNTEVEELKSGMTAIHFAARSRNPRILELIIGAGANCQRLDGSGRTAIHHLILGFKTLKRVPRAPKSDGDCLSMNATDCLALLIQKCGIDYLSKPADWDELCPISYNSWNTRMTVHSPLSLAILLGDWELFHELHRAGARFETNLSQDSWLLRPFLALQPDAVDILVANGAHLRADDLKWFDKIYVLSTTHTITPDEIERLKAILTRIIPCGFDINTKDRNGESLLHHTIRRGGFEELTDYVLEMGANPYLENGECFDSFMLAILHDRFDTLQHLLNHVKQQQPSNIHLNQYHWTKYLKAPETGHRYCMVDDACASIHSYGSINTMLGSGTLLCHAVISQNLRLVKGLLKHGADMSIEYLKGKRPLHLAAEIGNALIVEALVRSGEDHDVCDDKKRTALHLSALKGHTEVVKSLLSSGADPTVADMQGWHPLHYAAWAGHPEVAHCLISTEGSVLEAKTLRWTSEGSWNRPSGLAVGQKWTGTPLHLAAMTGNVEIVRSLLTSEESISIDARTDDFELGPYEHWPPIPGGGPTALHIALDTRTFYGPREPTLSKARLEIASLLVKRDANVQGVADHLTIKDVQRFKEFPQLWNKLRAGISSDE